MPDWRRRIAPLLLCLFLLFFATSLAADKPVQQVLEAQNPGSIDPSHSTPDDDQLSIPTASPLAGNVRDAVAILRKINPPSVSKLAQITRRRRKGILGTAAYYAKEAFMILFMNSPTPSSTLISPTEGSTQKLGQPLVKAVKLLEAAALEYNEDAMFLLAEMNFYGNFTHPVNYGEAFRWYHELADFAGNSTAQYMLGFMHATGLNPSNPADQAKSMLYHTFAAEQGNTRSEMTLAYRNHAGVSTPRNCDEAVHWYKRVAKKAVQYYRSGPPGGHSLIKNAYRIADEDGGVYGEGASVASSGANAKVGDPTSNLNANVEDVLEYFHLQASKGELRSTFQLARLYYDGSRNLKPDWKLAKEYFLQTAREYWARDGRINKGVGATTERLASKAAGYLGRMFLRGEGMTQDYAKARIWFLRGVSNGEPLSQYSLGLMHLEGLGVKKDAYKASMLFSAAADQDLAVAQTHLGMLFLDQGDTTTAEKYFELAARNGHIEAFYYLAEMYDQGIGRDRSCGVAAAYYKIVAEKSEPVWGSLSEANAAYDDGEMSTALMGYLMAAEQGSEAAQANVAWLLDHSRPLWSPISRLFPSSQSTQHAAEDAATALLYWTRSAKQKNVDSYVKMGDYYLAGTGGALSAENAAACYQAAADTMQSAQAMWNLGWMHENGVGITQDFHLAKRFYDKALETNHEAYLPVKVSLFKLRWRSWWNDITHGGVNGIRPDDTMRKRRTFTEWLAEFLENDALLYYEQQENDDWANEHDLAAGDDYWDSAAAGEDIDDGVLETLLIGGLVAALGWLIYYRQQQQQRAAAERRRHEDEQQQGGAPNPAANVPAAAIAPVPDQQPDGGFFPPPDDPNFGAWVAGGIGH